MTVKCYAVRRGILVSYRGKIGYIGILLTPCLGLSYATLRQCKPFKMNPLVKQTGLTPSTRLKETKLVRYLHPGKLAIITNQFVLYMMSFVYILWKSITIVFIFLIKWEEYCNLFLFFIYKLGSVESVGYFLSAVILLA